MSYEDFESYWAKNEPQGATPREVAHYAWAAGRVAGVESMTAEIAEAWTFNAEQELQDLRAENARLKSELQDEHRADKDLQEMVGKYEQSIGFKDEEIARLKQVLAVSEDFRRAYQDGKYKLYAMGGEICDAAANHLPMGEGPLDRAARKALKEQP